MRYFVLLVTTLVWCSSAAAAESVDADLKAALLDIARYEQQLSAGSLSASSARRTLKLLGISRGRLDGSTAKGASTWVEADARHQRLIEQLNAVLAGGGGAAVAAPAPAPASVNKVPKPATAPASSSGTSQMISQQRVRVNKLKRDIESASQSVDQGGSKPFQNPAYAKKFEQKGAGFQKQLDRYAEFSADTDVVAATAALTKYRGLLQVAAEHAASELAAIGDVSSQLEAIQERQKRWPKLALEGSIPHSIEVLDGWFDSNEAIAQQIATDQKVLEQIYTRGYLERGASRTPGVWGTQGVEVLSINAKRRSRNAQEATDRLAKDYENQLSQTSILLKQLNAIDPASKEDRMGALLGMEARRRWVDLMDKEEVGIKSAMHFFKRQGQPGAGGQQLAALKKARLSYRSKQKLALNSVRMPDSASDDKSLLSIARETLRNPDYEVGEPLQMVVNSERVARTKESSEVEFDEIDISLSGNVKLSGTETTTKYAWEQYQVATAEAVGEEYFIFYNTFKFFTAGATTTPLNRWLLSGRMQGEQILEEHLAN